MSSALSSDILDEQSFKFVEFPKLLELISNFAESIPTKQFLLTLKPLKDIEEITYRHSIVQQIRTFIIQSNESFEIRPVGDLDELFKRLQPQDAILLPEELLKLIPLLSSVISIKSIGRKLPDGVLKEYIIHFFSHPDILFEIERCINPDGSISDDASSELRNIRKKIKTLKNRIKSILEKMFQDPEKLHHIQDTYITERNGRYVIPVKADHKGHIKGVIHDVSNTEATVFIEPAETVSLGNELENLKAEEKILQWKVLKSLSALVREHLYEIEHDYQRLIYLEAMLALAKFAEQMNMTVPEITDKREVVIRKGKHPLLWHVMKESNTLDRLVPLDFELGRDFRCLIITGSNAGGKTVALKTIGLLTAMALTGMHVPAEEGSKFFFFKKIMVDIGDEQSIEANLSTFSAHLLRMKTMLNEVNDESLILIDELGTGTDPEEGGALGAAFLESFLKKGALVVSTTHLSFLKAFALKHPLMKNAAMLVETIFINGQPQIKPTYKLSIGQTGASHALSIAESLGTPEEVITLARSFLKEKNSLIEDAMQEIAQLKNSIEKELEHIKNEKRIIQEIKHAIQEQLEQIKQKRKKYLQDAYKKALAIVEKTKKKAWEQLEQIKISSQSEIKKKLDRLNQLETQLSQKIYKEEKPIAPEQLRPGIYVRIGRDGPIGQIIKIHHNRVTVMVRGLQIETDCSNLYLEEKKPDETSYLIAYESDSLPDNLKLDVRGLKTDEAINEVDKALNKATVSGITEIYIIHGKGKGILKSKIREFLQSHPLVKDYRAGSDIEGGEGVTVVTLK